MYEKVTNKSGGKLLKNAAVGGIISRSAGFVNKEGVKKRWLLKMGLLRNFRFYVSEISRLRAREL